MDDKRLFLKKFEEKLKTQLSSKEIHGLKQSDFEQFEGVDTIEYEEFRKEALNLSSNIYEKACNFALKALPIEMDAKTSENIQYHLDLAHINTKPAGVAGLSALVSMSFIIFGMVLFVLNLSTIISMGVLITGVLLFFIFQQIPIIIAKRFRAKASDQVIMAIFYIVAYMRFNSNFELAVSFAAHYLSPPLSLDFKRILWDLNNSKYPNLKAAFDDYLEGWRDENLEFLEAIYLIESSLYESEDIRRISLLDKSLDIILQGNYEKVLHFSQELKGKVSTFNMLGIVLPILMLIILPLAASFGSPKSVWELVFILFDILLPIIVGFFGYSILSNRPSGSSGIKKPNLKNIKQLQQLPFKIGKKTMYLSAKIPALLILFIFLTIGFFPIIAHSIIGGGEDETSCTNSYDATLNSYFSSISKEPFNTFADYKFIDKGSETYCYGPYGLYPGLISLFIPLGIAFAIGYYFRISYKQLVHLRDKTKKLEKEFPTATFQLGNRINEGISIELAFGLVAETMKGTETGNFFSAIDSNIKFNGMSIEKAIFDPEKGAILEYPSEIIESSMKITVKAIEKGPEITAKTLIDLSRYLNEIHSGQERMKDLLAESLSSMKGQVAFLAPLISGIVISIVSLITMIMGTLAEKTNELASSTDAASVNGFLGDSIPTFLFQSVVGIYIAMLILILVYMITNLEDGEDIINTRYQMGEKIISGMTKYSVVVFLGILLFGFVGTSVLSNL
jgi:hypothetical protein